MVLPREAALSGSWYTPAGIALGTTLSYPSATMANEGLYTVVPSIGPCLGGTIELWVDLMVPEVLDLGADTVFCDGGEFLINLPLGFSAQIWSTGSTGSWILVSEGGTYSVYADDAQGCKVYDEIALDLVECPPAMPTVFTPNGDGVNDVIRLDQGGFTHALLLIFDRYGTVVWEGDPSRTAFHDKNSRNAEDLSEGNCFYVFTLQRRAGRSQEIKGSFSLLR